MHLKNENSIGFRGFRFFEVFFIKDELLSLTKATTGRSIVKGRSSNEEANVTLASEEDVLSLDLGFDVFTVDLKWKGQIEF